LIVSAIDFAEANETYRIAIEVSTIADDFATITVEVGTLTLLASLGTGRYYVPFTNEPKKGLQYGMIRCTHNLGGTTPSVQYKARIRGPVGRG
jgi:hypothetical protein